MIVRDHAAPILARRPRCMLCGQRMLDVRRVKTHWQAVHKTEWSRYSSAARQHCNTLSKAVKRPCQFCNSNAKGSNLHAAQCPMLFQALMLHELRKASAASAEQDAPRPTLPRRSEQVAKYKSFSLASTPLSMAFRRSGSSVPQPHRPASAPLQPQTAHWLLVAARLKGRVSWARSFGLRWPSRMEMFWQVAYGLYAYGCIIPTRCAT